MDDYESRLEVNNTNLTAISTVIDNLPDYISVSYIPLEYIESTGTQYINTGVKAKGVTRLVLDFENTLSASETQMYSGALFGGRDGAESSTFCLWINWMAGNYGCRSDYNTTANSLVHVDNITDRFLVDKNRGYTVMIDSDRNLTSQTITNTTFTSSYDIYLFAKNNAGTADSFTRYRLYNCKIYDNSVLVRDFIPVKRVSDNTICLYDRINNTFYLNQGTGVFSSGPIL